MLKIPLNCVIFDGDGSNKGPTKLYEYGNVPPVDVEIIIDPLFIEDINKLTS